MSDKCLAALEKRWAELHGQAISAAEAAELKAKLGDAIPAWLIDALQQFPLAETVFDLTKDQDLSGLGVCMGWLDPAGILSEAFDLFPGILAVRVGYLPIGSCLFGSGDY